MTIWFISDTHFTHENMLKFTRPNGELLRPFASVEEMDELMVENWNKRVKPSDHVYHLGDVAMKRPHLQIVKRLNGHKRLLFGNHDIFDYQSYIEVGFEKVMGYRVLNNILFSHIPINIESLGRFKFNAHGHVHMNSDKLPPESFVNLCVEAINYTPISLEELSDGR